MASNALTEVRKVINRGNSFSLEAKRVLRAAFEKMAGESGMKGSGWTGTGTVHSTSVRREGDNVTTTILLDLTGLNSAATGDIIGGNGLANCHFGQILSEVNGTILGGTITCLEAPATGDVDIDVYSATESTGVEDAAIGTLTPTVLHAHAGNWSAGQVGVLAPPADRQFLYLTSGGAGASATYSAGKFKIEFVGYVS
jgi:hypothetical protein